jgi:large subunit ribosomal protein L35
MGYKFKPNKAVKKRFKVTRTGKLKRHHAFTSHLMSARPAKKRRKLRRPAILYEGFARNMRELMGISHLKPGKIEHERALVAKKRESGEPAAREPATTARPVRSPERPSAPRENKATQAPARAGAAKPRA